MPAAWCPRPTNARSRPSSRIRAPRQTLTFRNRRVRHTLRTGRDHRDVRRRRGREQPDRRRSDARERKRYGQPEAVPGWRAVRLVTGGEFATLTPAGSEGPGFNRCRQAQRHSRLYHRQSRARRRALHRDSDGSATHFLRDDAGVVRVGRRGAVQVVSPTELSASIAVTGVAVEGLRDVTATTGGEVSRLVGGFTSYCCCPPVDCQRHAVAQHKAHRPLSPIVGVNTHFTTDVCALADNRQQHRRHRAAGRRRHDPHGVDCNQRACRDGRPAVHATGAATLTFDFAVQPSLALLVGLTPPSGGQGRTVAVAMLQPRYALAGRHDDGDLRRPPSCIDPVVTRVTVGSATSAVESRFCQTPVRAGAPPRADRRRSRDPGVWRRRADRQPHAEPVAAMVGRTVTVNFLGEFSHLGGQTTVVRSTALACGAEPHGDERQDATATCAVAADALPGLRSVTLTSPLSGGAFEVLTAAFVVTTTPAIHTAIEPFHASPGVWRRGQDPRPFHPFQRPDDGIVRPQRQVSNLAVVSESGALVRPRD